MSLKLPQWEQVRAGEWANIRWDALVCRYPAHLDYELADDLIARGEVVVEEVSAAGQVSLLVADNRCSMPALFLEGQHLVGAKQDRMVNTTVLVEPGRQRVIPVSCVERGRWQYRSRHFETSGRRAGARMRSRMKPGVNRALQEGRGHASDQKTVWDEVEQEQAELRVQSTTHSHSDTFAAFAGECERAQQEMQLPVEAVGFVIVIGNRLVLLELFDRASTCQRVWQQTVPGIRLDALRFPGDAPEITEAWLFGWSQSLSAEPWTVAPAIGAGEEFRTGQGTTAGEDDSRSSTLGSALVVDGRILHLTAQFAL